LSGKYRKTAYDDSLSENLYVAALNLIIARLNLSVRIQSPIEFVRRIFRMSDEITPEIFQHMVRLAALELNQEESEYLRQQLNNQLKAIHELEAIPLADDVKPTSHGVPYTDQITPPIRMDEWQPYPHPEEILAEAPESQDGYIVVPEIPHIDLE